MVGGAGQEGGEGVGDLCCELSFSEQPTTLFTHTPYYYLRVYSPTATPVGVPRRGSAEPEAEPSASTVYYYFCETPTSGNLRQWALAATRGTEALRGRSTWLDPTGVYGGAWGTGTQTAAQLNEAAVRVGCVAVGQFNLRLYLIYIQCLWGMLWGPGTNRVHQSRECDAPPLFASACCTPGNSGSDR